MEETHFKNFVVVSFECDNSVEVVPKTWLSEDKKKCSYPKKIPTNFHNLRTNCNSTPGNNWNSFTIDVIKSYGKTDIITIN